MRVCDRVSCDIHPAMRATPFLTRAPYVVQVPDTGTFNFRDVVPGSYKVSGFIEGTSIDQTLEISGAETKLQVPGNPQAFRRALSCLRCNIESPARVS